MKCMSTCFPCWCGSKNSARVTPADPLEVVSPNAGVNGSRYRRTTDDQNGGGGGEVNPNFIAGEGDDEPATSQGNPAIKSLYIEVGKDRLLRVIHVKNRDNEPASRKASVDGSETDFQGNFSGELSPVNAQPTSPTVNLEDMCGGCGDDDEEEYWFTKWARKPRFRSIFAKNTEHHKPPKPGNSESNNNNSVNPEETNKVTAELEMARAAAAAKRRAWAYNNNGNCESTIMQQPTVNPGDEEEFNSIAIVSSNKQQWTKQGGQSGSDTETPEASESNDGNTSSSSQVEVEVSVEKNTSAASSKAGISNPAFQEDDDDEYDNCETYKTENSSMSKTNNTTISAKSRSPSNQSTASTQAVEDEITAEEPSSLKSNSPTSNKSCSPPGYYTPPVDPVLAAVPKKPILFFVHSIAGSSDVWHRQFEFFQQLGYEIVAPDLLGHGLSSTPLNPKYYFFESLVQDLILIFDHFCKEEDTKVVLIGHGYGACLAAMLTRVRLKHVALFISIAGGGPTPLVRRTCCQESWLSWKCKLFHRNRIRGRFDNPELKHVLPTSIHESLLAGQVWPDGDSAFYRRITVPTLLTYGMRDKVVTLVEECEMERTIPKSFLELIDSAGHLVMQDAPDKLNKMLCKFLQSWS